MPESIKPLSFAQLRAKDFTPDPYIIGGGLLPENGLLIIGGPPKAYKSFVLLSIIHSLMTASPLFGATRHHGKGVEVIFPCEKPRRVLYLEQEIGFQDTYYRLQKMYESSFVQKWWDDNLFIHSRDYDMRLDHDSGMAHIGKLIDAVKPDVVILDPLVEFHSLDENKQNEMMAVLQRFSRLQASHGFSGILSHHNAKVSLDAMRQGPENLRGSSVIFGKGDSFINITPANRSAGLVTLDFTFRRAVPPKEMSLLINPSTLLMEFHCWGTLKKTEEKFLQAWADEDSKKGQIQ